MKNLSLVLAVLLFSAAGGDGVERGSRPIPDFNSNPTLTSRVPEPPLTPVQPGDPAPDVSWTGADNRSHRLHEVLDQANALLVFAPDYAALQSLEAARNDLADMGVVPVALVEARGGWLAAHAKQLGLHYLVVSDARRVIASQFVVVNPTTERTVPAWFAVDHRGLVRASWIGSLPTEGWVKIAASSFALPLPETPRPASN